MKQISDKEFHAVVSRSEAARYEYAIKNMADWGEVWSIRSDGGWVLFGDGQDEMIPIWPHLRYAQACCSSGEVPQSIPIDEWMIKWIPGIRSDGRKIVVFPVGEKLHGPCVNADRLESDMQRELDRIE